MFIGVPGLCVVAPSHLVDPGELLVRAALAVRDPVLFVENKLLYSQRLVLENGDRLGELFVHAATDGCFPTIRVGLTEDARADAVLVAYGGNVPLALTAARELLLDEEVVCDVVVPSLLSPVPTHEIAELLGACRRVVVVEESPRTGSWGGELIASLVERFATAGRTYARVAAADSPIPSSKALEAELLPGADAVKQAVRLS
jgi:pyruvate/2-oxoglutarate/acetoin dehydrogenase E1 component